MSGSPQPAVRREPRWSREAALRTTLRSPANTRPSASTTRDPHLREGLDLHPKAESCSESRAGPSTSECGRPPSEELSAAPRAAAPPQAMRAASRGGGAQGPWNRTALAEATQEPGPSTSRGSRRVLPRRPTQPRRDGSLPGPDECARPRQRPLRFEIASAAVPGRTRGGLSRACWSSCRATRCWRPAAGSSRTVRTRPLRRARRRRALGTALDAEGGVLIASPCGRAQTARVAPEVHVAFFLRGHRPRQGARDPADAPRVPCAKSCR